MDVEGTRSRQVAGLLALTLPAVLVGVGLVAHSVLTSVPASLAVASGDIALLPVMCVIVLPVWLLVIGRPGMLVRPAPAVPTPP